MYTWDAAWQNQQNGHCAQRRHRSACASAQSDQSLRCPHEETLGPQLPIERTAKTLIRLGGAQGSLVRAPALLHTGYTCNLRRISHDIMYMVFLLFPLIQERQFLIISESICTLDHFVPVNCLEGLRLSARRSGLNRSFNCIPEIHRPWIGQSDLLVHARDSRNPKPILA